MEYFYLKLGRGNSLVQESLVGATKPEARIFFDNFSLDDYEAGKGGNEPREFVRRGNPEFHHRTLMVVVHEGEIWVLRPAGKVKFLAAIRNEEGITLTPKVMPIEIVAHRFAKEVPPVLAGIGANQNYARGTFRRINDWGNYKAIDWITGRVGLGDHWDLSQQGADQLLECLGSTELETLVARLLEEHGCFVPAYRGGMMKDIDLFAHNDGGRPIEIGPINVPARGGISIQVKRWAEGMHCPDGVDCLIGLGVTGPKSIDGSRLLKLLTRSPHARKWLVRSLQWLPGELLTKFDLCPVAANT